MTAEAGESRNLFERLRTAKGRAARIKAMCLHCMGCTSESMSEGCRAAIRNCTCETCPLWDFRPYRAGDSDDEVEVVDEVEEQENE